MKSSRLLSIIAIVVLVFIAIAAYAQPRVLTISESQRLRQEKTALTEWIVAHTKNSKQPVTAVRARKIVESVYEYSSIHQTDPLLVLSIMRNESGFRDNAKSSYGAKGLMQVVPRYHKEKLNKRNPFTPEVNIDVGIQVLREYLDSAGGKTKHALNKYSGGASGYYRKVAGTYKELAKHLVEHAFFHEYPITVVYSIDKPVIPASTAVTVVASN